MPVHVASGTPSPTRRREDAEELRVAQRMREYAAMLGPEYEGLRLTEPCGLLE
ncbi:hypothetical protein ACIBEA_19635 [Streptomyces sp. NPDC051555]|uniref:hypothetical protein n=1 Tax=Streptomyces sp. NPDC051555 TaxID=3365657 RepID=UPI0037A30BAC